MKIAVVTLDGENISQHFGRSPYYKIFTIKNDKIVSTEMRQRGTGHFAPNRNTEETHSLDANGRHGYGAEADSKHATMADEINDCAVLIAGGMGEGAYKSFKRAGLNVFLTDHIKINTAVDELIKGTLANLFKSRTD